MPQFSYEAVTKQNEIRRGVLDMDSAEDVAALLRETGLYAYSIKAKRNRMFFGLKKRRAVKQADLAQLSKQFATLINAGITVPASLSILARQSSNAVLSKALKNIAADVSGGVSLADAFAKYPDVFDDLYVAMLRAGEVGGTLESILNRLSVHLEKEKKLRDNIRTAVNYPKVVGIFAAVMFFAMMVFLVPVFKQFTASNPDIPGVTLFIFSVSDSMRCQWYLWIASICAIVAVVTAFMRSRAGYEFWERFKLRMPFFGSLISKTVISRFVRTLATLIRGGIPIARALETAGPTSGSMLIANAVEAAAREIEIGRNLSRPLTTSGIFPPMVTEMIAVGEESGNLPEMLDKISEFYDEEIEIESKNLSTVIEPLLLIVVGFLVGGMLIALYLPMFTSVISVV
jgi:type IV pilus assembly protein PilC